MRNRRFKEEAMAGEKPETCRRLTTSLWSSAALELRRIIYYCSFPVVFIVMTDEMADTESCSSRAVDFAPSQSRKLQTRNKVEVYQEVLCRLKETNEQETRKPGFEDELWTHFHRLPKRSSKPSSTLIFVFLLLIFCEKIFVKEWTVVITMAHFHCNSSSSAWSLNLFFEFC